MCVLLSASGNALPVLVTPLKLARNRQQALSSCFILCELEPPFLIPNKHITKLVKAIMVQRESPLEAKG